MSESSFQFCPRCRAPLEARERGGALRAVCTAPGCGFTHWNNPVPVVAAIVERDGHVILVRSRGWPEHYFALVAGFLETGETPEEAVLREVREELGLDASIETFVGAYPFARLNQILFTYHLSLPRGEIVLDETELESWKAVPLAALKPWPLGTGPALRDWLRARGFDPAVVDLGEARYD